MTQAMSFPSSPSEAEQTPGFGRLAKPETPLLSNRRPVHELLADSLRLTMMAGYHLPGVRLNQEDPALDYGVSGMRVREALLNLQSEGRVIQSPHKGSAAAALVAKDVEPLSPQAYFQTGWPPLA